MVKEADNRSSIVDSYLPERQGYINTSSGLSSLLARRAITAVYIRHTAAASISHSESPSDSFTAGFA